MAHIPEFEGPIKGWAINFSKKHYWRVERTIPWEDLGQEMYIVFLRLKRKYPDLETPQHFMALFKTAWTNQFHTFAHEDTHQRFLVPELVETDESWGVPEPMGDLNHDGELGVKLRQAPREITMVLNLILNAPTEMLEIVLASWNGTDKRCKAGGSRTICRALGLDQNRDIMQEVHDYFTS